MKNIKFPLYSLIFALLLFVSGALGQQGDPPGEAGPRPPQMGGPQEIRANMLRRLGLNNEQLASLRKVNSERQPRMHAAQKRLQEASRMLDDAIYADAFSQESYDARLREVQEAQSEITRLRFEGELAIRKVLTAEQLVRFRTMRELFEEMRPRQGPMRPDPGPGRGGPMRREGPMRRPAPPQ
jgi:Spy/CpxP family protein refolding chaperone